jgi:putative endonuclease
VADASIQFLLHRNYSAIGCIEGRPEHEGKKMSYMYILKCCDGTFYTGSTVDLEKRQWQHQNCEGANYTKTRLPVELVYYEQYERIEEAFKREKQVQNWSRKKKIALINGNANALTLLAKKSFFRLPDPESP